jgi:hypothetical protein
MGLVSFPIDLLVKTHDFAFAIEVFPIVTSLTYALFPRIVLPLGGFGGNVKHDEQEGWRGKGDLLA